MPALSRIGDIGTGVCTSHKSPISTCGILIGGASTVMANGASVSRIGDLVLGFCGHIGVMCSGAGTVKAEGVGVVRSGDSFSGAFSGTLITGCPNVIAGG